MTLYFGSPVEFPDSEVISTHGCWHPKAPLLAIGGYSQERGGFIAVFDELGDQLRDMTFPLHPVSQVTALVWHPEKHMLVCSWESGDIHMWSENDKEFINLNGPHTVPVNFLAFSEKGGRMVSADASGSLVGWKVDLQGNIITTFHHHLKDSITHLVFKLSVTNSRVDIEGLAKAAVNGDESALDLFSEWRPKTTARQFKMSGGADNHCFFVGTQTGAVHYINETGSCVQVLSRDNVPLAYMLHHPSRDALVIMKEGFNVEYFSVLGQGQLAELAKIKLSGKAQMMRGAHSQNLVWAGNSSLAILTGELTVRMWNVDTNDNYVLPIYLKSFVPDDRPKQFSEAFTCMSYFRVNQTICAGTNLGQLYFWLRRHAKTDYIDSPEETWVLHNVSAVSGSIKQLMWGALDQCVPLVAVNCVTKVYVLKEQALSVCYAGHAWAVQKTASQVLLETPASNSLLRTELQVTGMALADTHLVLTNGKLVTMYNLALRMDGEPAKARAKDSNVSALLAHTFPCDNKKVLLHNQDLVLLAAGQILIKSPTGLTLAAVALLPAEGEPIDVNLTGNSLTLYTVDGCLKLFDLSQREPRLVAPVRNLYDMLPDFGEIICAKSNSAGTKVALTVATSNLVPDKKLYVWDVEADRLTHYDFGNAAGGEGEGEGKDEGEHSGHTGTDLHDFKIDYARICAGRLPMSFCWDAEDPRLLVCAARKLRPDEVYGSPVRKQSGEQNLQLCDHVVVTMFVSTEHGMQIQDIRAVDSSAKLVVAHAPHIVLLNKQMIMRLVMHDFSGLEHCDRATKEAVLDFSFNLSCGNMDAAFKSIKLVQSAGVWHSLARMCVKTRRLDVAAVCLGHMKDARAARALRRAMQDTCLPLEAKVAVLAVQLGLLDEAEQLYVACERYDLLNQLYRARHKMDLAVTIAETKDRIHLRNTEHAWGRYLEEVGAAPDAIQKYESANTHLYNVPKMLLDCPADLEAYIAKSNNKDLFKWWGQYVESQGEMSAALKYYERAGDLYSQVRVLCFLGEEAKAAELARHGTDKAACYHMGRYYETNSNIDAAIGFFIKANAYSNAIRLCTENKMSEELWNLGMVVGRKEKLECAKYFEENEQVDKAVLLYHRAGMLHKSLDLAFRTQQFDALQQMTSDLDTNSDPALVERCAQYFIENQQYDKAVDLLAIARKYIEALDVCLTHNIQLTEQLAEHLTPAKEQTDERTRNEVLEKVGECLFSQGNYHLATKKFTQAGDKVRAMKALLKSGDTEKITFFANVSRQKEIYIMAANYLQSLDWQNDPDILKNIITFYSKGRAMDLLANFYVACAQVEIDEFQNYEKALGAMNEASRCLNKVTSPKDPNQHSKAVDIVHTCMANIQKFVDIRRLLEQGDGIGAMAQCRSLLLSGGENLEQSVRRGDIYALMIQNSIKMGDYAEAKRYVQELQQILTSSGNSSLTYYLSKEVLEVIVNKLNIPFSELVPQAQTAPTTSTEQANENEIQEEVED